MNFTALKDHFKTNCIFYILGLFGFVALNQVKIAPRIMEMQQQTIYECRPVDVGDGNAYCKQRKISPEPRGLWSKRRMKECTALQSPTPPCPA
jgi:hypothetical protein